MVFGTSYQFLFGKRVFELKQGVHITFPYSRINGCASIYSLLILRKTNKVYAST